MKKINIVLIILISMLFSESAMIFDHSSIDITTITQDEVQRAKDYLHIAYGHTSHGSQITDGMNGLVGFANGGGKGLAFPTDFFDWNNGGTDGALDLMEGDGYGDGPLDHDCGYYPSWVDETSEYLNDVNNSDVNVIMWSWCGQISYKGDQRLIDEYLGPMTQFENDYPDITFVYMTGHSDGGGEEGSVHINNQQIRDYCIENKKVLLDFYDIECYDPDGNYYGDKYVTDNCDYDSNGDGSTDKNWATEWQNSHTENVDWYNCGSAHSQPLNANQKAYAVWKMFAEIAKMYDPNLTIEPQDEEEIIHKFKLHKCYPNPFNPATNIKISLPKQSDISIKVFDVMGKQVAELFSGNINAGIHGFQFDGSGFPSGIYFYKLQSNNFSAIEKMVLLK